MDDTITSFGTFASPAKLNSRMNDFKTICKLGEGSYSIVYKVQRQTDGKIYALKKVQMSRLNEKEKANSLNEIRILASIRSDHVIEYRDSFFDESSDSLCIIMEFAGDGDLLSKLMKFKNYNEKLGEQEEKEREEISNLNSIKSEIDQSKDNQILEEGIVINGKVYMNEETIWDYWVQSVKGLQSLHEMGILHRDLKCANLFVGTHNILKIGDLNVSKVTKRRTEDLTHTQTGTPYYTAPEVWKGKPYQVKSDVWSLGCIMYELCAQKPPFRGNTIEGLFTNIIKGTFERIPAHYSDELAMLIALCLKKNPKYRPNCEQLMQMPSIYAREHGYEQKYAHFLNSARKKKKMITPEKIILNNLDKHPHLIDTIRLPSTWKQLSALLPKSNYDDHQPSIREFHVHKHQESEYFNDLHKLQDHPKSNFGHNQKNISPSQSNQTDLFSSFSALMKVQIQQHDSENININSPAKAYHNLIDSSPIRLTLKKVHMDISSTTCRKIEEEDDDENLSPPLPNKEKLTTTSQSTHQNDSSLIAYIQKIKKTRSLKQSNMTESQNDRNIIKSAIKDDNQTIFNSSCNQNVNKYNNSISYFKPSNNSNLSNEPFEFNQQTEQTSSNELNELPSQYQIRFRGRVSKVVGRNDQETCSISPPLSNPNIQISAKFNTNISASRKLNNSVEKTSPPRAPEQQQLVQLIKRYLPRGTLMRNGIVSVSKRMTHTEKSQVQGLSFSPQQNKAPHSAKYPSHKKVFDIGELSENRNGNNTNLLNYSQKWTFKNNAIVNIKKRSQSPPIKSSSINRDIIASKENINPLNMFNNNIYNAYNPTKNSQNHNLYNIILQNNQNNNPNNYNSMIPSNQNHFQMHKRIGNALNILNQYQQSNKINSPPKRVINKHFGSSRRNIFYQPNNLNYTNQIQNHNYNPQNYRMSSKSHHLNTMIEYNSQERKHTRSFIR